jgi:threonine/homoserine efflux transporter RhtA
VSGATLLSLLPATAATCGLVLVARGSTPAREVGVVLLVACGTAVAGSAALAALRFRSLPVGLLAAPGLVATQAAYLGGFLHGVARGR